MITERMSPRGAPRLDQAASLSPDRQAQRCSVSFGRIRGARLPPPAAVRVCRGLGALAVSLVPVQSRKVVQEMSVSDKVQNMGKRLLALSPASRRAPGMMESLAPSDPPRLPVIGHAGLCRLPAPSGCGRLDSDF